MAGVEKWAKLSFEFDLSSLRNNNSYLSERPKLTAQYHDPYPNWVGADVKIVGGPNSTVNLIIHCFVFEKMYFKLLQPDKCLHIKILPYIVQDEPKVHHIFDQLSFRMSSINKYIEFESFTDCYTITSYLRAKLIVGVNVDCIKEENISVNIPYDLEKLITDPILSDVDLVVEGHVFKAHKAVLVARCEYFEKMFSTEMREQRNNRVEIEEVEKDVFKLFFDYIYTGKVKANSSSEKQKLMMLADRFQAVDFKRAVAGLMLDNLNPENAVGYLNLANAINQPELKSAAIEFIYLNKNQI